MYFSFTTCSQYYHSSYEGRFWLLSSRNFFTKTWSCKCEMKWWCGLQPSTNLSFLRIIIDAIFVTPVHILALQTCYKRSTHMKKSWMFKNAIRNRVWSSHDGTIRAFSTHGNSQIVQHPHHWSKTNAGWCLSNNTPSFSYAILDSPLLS